jgi:hypothetical protein
MCFLHLILLCAVLHLLICICQPSLRPRSKNNSHIVYNFFSVLLNLVCKYFIENFCVCVHQGNWSIIFIFFVVFLSSFGIRVMLAL